MVVPQGYGNPAPSGKPTPKTHPWLFDERAAERFLAEVEEFLFHDADFALVVEVVLDTAVQGLLDLDRLAQRWKTKGRHSDPLVRRELERRAAEHAAEAGVSFVRARHLVKREALQRAGFPDAKRLTFADLADMIRDDDRVRGRRTLTVKTVGGREQFGGALEDSLTRLTRFFGASRALAITSDRVRAYERELLDKGYARATVNKDLAALRRAFNLAVKARRLPASAKPVISTPDPRNARQGFFEEADFRAVLAELPEPLRPVMEFCYLTGWRPMDEVLPLTWDRVDFGAGLVRAGAQHHEERRGP